MVRVGFLFGHHTNESFRLWTGGLNYFHNLFHALESLEDRRVEPVLFTGTGESLELVSRFSGFPAVKSFLLDRDAKPTLRVRAERRLRRLLNPELRAERDPVETLLRDYGVRVLSHSIALFPDSPVRQLGWIPDFQHKALPDFFSKDELASRDAVFAETARKSARLLVSSHTVKEDVRRYLPDAVDKCRVLHFCASASRRAKVLPLSELTRLHGIEGPYFHLPNQFWVHKNHRVVIEALQILKSRNLAVTVVATGNTSDYRFPAHYDELMRLTEQLGVKASFRSLGQLPYDQVVSLMRYSVGVINPSESEGWSTTVEEAKAMGKRLILSDLPVMREQATENAFFFPKKDPDRLAALMEQLWESRSPRDEDERYEAAEASHRRRELEFARTFQDIVLEAAGN